METAAAAAASAAEPVASEGLKELVKEYWALDKDIKERAEKVKPKKQALKELGREVVARLKQEQLDGMNLPDGKVLILAQSHRKVRPKKETIIQKASEFLRNKEQAANLYGYIWDNCESVSSTCLSLRTPAKPKKKIATDDQ